MEIRPEVYSYELDWTYDEPLGVHVLDTDQATILFGAGSEATTDQLADIATDHEINIVIVEHGDADHYGGVPALRAAIDGLVVAAPADDVAALEAAGLEVDTPLASNDTYWGIRPIAAPGHTPGNMSYLYEEILVAGDTVVAADSPFAAAGDWSGPFAVIDADYNADDEQARDSVAVLAEYEFETVLLSHGANVTENGHDPVETLIEDFDQPKTT
ncbi:MBL fold metallo-hydrolase [Natrinema sp. 1APR25-10V2]|uniref:MBL fold metallo-hydrolase n=1 Tax=Natrinema sp. 1APR25-10V2 TaxID=2951081 RepID=UPI002874B645|nr:MBL fold metallo-hydrolase [Natrinema sp. 1APR25-10V2]MDS0477043.1 MBL fold metallo-hydrolase [Natrinema sp. 1APR25-10V2]